MKQARIDELYKDCPAALTRMTQEIHELLPSLGDPDADLMFIVDAPSREEENYGISFYGKSGAKMDELLQALNLDRDSAYLTHAVKYHPYKISLSTGRFSKRAIKQDEIDFFLPYLKDEIDIVRPKILITLGEMPLRALTGEEDLKLNSQHGKVRSVKILERTYKLLPMINPITMKTSENHHLAADIEVLKRLMGIDGEAEEAEDEEAIGRSDGHRQDMADAGFDNGQDYTVSDSERRVDFGASDSDSGGDFVPDLSENNLRMKEKNSQARQSSDMDKILPEARGMSDASGQPAKSAMRSRESAPSMTPVAIKEEASLSKTGKMKAVIVYGGDGFADDPTLVVLDRISQVLAELNTRIVRIDLYKKDYDFKSFQNELSEAKAVILATTVEWLGIGGRMQTFLDDCWRFANKQDFVGCYLFGVVISRQSNERDAYNHLIKSWELLGGLEGSSLCSRIAKSVDLETSSLLLGAIDKKTEEFFRIAQQGRTVMPTSIRSNRVYMEVPNTGTSAAETPAGAQDTGERTGRKLPEYDVYVERQQKDIEDLAQLFKQKMGTHSEGLQKSEPERFMKSYIGSDDKLAFKLQWNLDDRKARAFYMEIKGRKIVAKAGQIGDATITVQSDFATLDKILDGRLTVQRAFMTGEIKARGDFTVLYKMDGLFKL